MISCIWHGYTTFANADTYENLLKDEIIVPAKARQVLSHFDDRSQHYEVRNRWMAG